MQWVNRGLRAQPAGGRVDLKVIASWLITVIGFAVLISSLSDYHASIAMQVVLYAMLAASLNLALGFVGLFSLAHIGFYGLGAYGIAILQTREGWSYEASFAVTVIGVAVVALVVGYPAIRYTRGLFFALVTFAFSQVLYLLATTLYSVTGGPPGMSVPYQISVFGSSIGSDREYLILAAVLLTVMQIAISLVARGSTGLRLLSVREDPYLAEALGSHVRGVQLRWFAGSAAIAAVVGALTAPTMGYITPSIMGVQPGIQLLGVLIVGGVGTVWGPALGAALFALPPLLFSDYSRQHAVALGLLVVLTALYLPQGLLGVFRPERWLSFRKATAGTAR